MSKLEKLFGKGKEIEIEGIHLDIKPLTVNSLPLLMKMGQEGNPEEQAKAMREILVKTLKESVPDSTEEEIDKISLENLQQLMSAIIEVNQLEGIDSEDKEFLERIKKRQNVQHIGSAGNKKAESGK